jgi:hypothetical protein
MSDILVEALMHIDKNFTINQTESTPFLLLDGHGSRPETKWTVCIGVPYMVLTYGRLETHWSRMEPSSKQ